MAAKTQLQTIATPGRRLGSFSGKVVLTYADYGEPQLYTAANWSNVTIVFQATMAVEIGTVYGRAYNKTDSAAVSGSEVSSVSATFERVRSGALTLTDGKTYVSQFAKSAGATGAETKGGRLIMIPT